MHALRLGLLDHGLQVIDVGMHIAVGEQPQKMQGGLLVLHLTDEGAPGIRGKHLAGFDGLGNQLGTLGEYLPGSQRIVTHLRVPHVVIRGETDSGSVSLEPNHGIGGHQAVKGGRVCLGDSVTDCVRGKTHTIHDHGQHRACHTFKIGQLFQFFHNKGSFLSDDCQIHLFRNLLYYTLFYNKKQGVREKFICL